MLSKITICNLALAQLGQDPISSLTQEDERARLLNLFYEPVRDEVLRTHNWAFASTEEPLLLLDQHPQTGEFIYKYPQHALFIQRISGGKQAAAPFEERYCEAYACRCILTHVPQAHAVYTRKKIDETQFDASFVKIFSLALAVDLAVILTGDTSLATQLMQKYTLCLDEARRSNMQENVRFARSSDAFSEVR